MTTGVNAAMSSIVYIKIGKFFNVKTGFIYNTSNKLSKTLFNTFDGGGYRGYVSSFKKLTQPDLVDSSKAMINRPKAHVFHVVLIEHKHSLNITPVRLSYFRNSLFN